MKDILEILDEGIIVVNSETEVCYCNHQFEVQVGMNRGEILGRRIDNFLKVLKGEVRDTGKLGGLLYREEEAVFVEINTFIKRWNEQDIVIYVIKNTAQISKIRLYEEVLNQINFPIWIKDPEGKYYFKNSAMLKETKEEKSKNEIEKRQVFDNYIRCHVNRVNTKDENVFFEVAEDQKIFIEQLIPFRGNGTKGFSMGIRNDMTLLYHIGMEIESEENRCLKEIGDYITNEALISEWEADESIQHLQERAQKDFQINTVILGIFTQDKRQCLMSYSVKDEPFRKKIVSVDQVVAKRLKSIEQKCWSLKENKQFQEDIIGLVSQSVSEKLLSYEVYPIRFAGEIIGCITFAFDENVSNIINKVYTIQLNCHQVAALIISKLLGHDIREALRREKAIEAELKCLLEVSTDLIIVLDENGFVLTARAMNKQLREIVGWTCAEVIGRDSEEFIHPDDKNLIYQEAESKKPERLSSIKRVRCKNGKYIWCEWYISYSEESRTYICTAKDINERKKHEVEREAYKQAKEIEAIRTQFFANLSHEFRTPLNIILSSIKLLNHDATQDDIRWCTEKIEHNALRLLKLSNNLIDLTKIDVGNERVDFKKENIINIIEDITLKAVPYAKRGHIEIIFDTDQEEVIMACDREKIERMMLNMLSNAIKFTPKGGQISVTLSSSNEEVEIRVKDTGIGIPEEKQKTIFEKFVQVDTSLRRRCEGNGMGLSIVKRIVEIHQGSIQVESEEGQGTTFIVRLPLQTRLNEKVAEAGKKPLKVTIDQVKVEFSDIYYD